MSWRVIVVLSATGIALGLLSTKLSRERSRSEQATVRFEPETFYFGKVRQAETLNGNLKFINRSTTTIRIIGASSSCSCTFADGVFVGRKLRPGESCEVPLRMKTGAYDGEMVSTITIHYKASGNANPKPSVATAAVVADVLPDFRITPSVVDFGTVDIFTPLSRAVHVAAEYADTGGDDIKEVFSSSKVFQPHLTAKSSNSHDAVVDIVFDGSGLNQSDTQSGLILIKTNSTRTPELKVLARAIFQSPIEVTPVAIVAIEKDPVPDKEILIRTSYLSQLEGMDPMSEYIEAMADGTSKSRSHKLTVRFDRDTPESFDSELRVRLRIDTRESGSVLHTAAVPVHRLRQLPLK